MTRAPDRDPFDNALTCETQAVVDAEADRLLVDQINAWTKRQITDAYSFGLISEQTAMELIRENGLVHA